MTNPTPPVTCPRCGKTVWDDVHTCSPQTPVTVPEMTDQTKEYPGFVSEFERPYWDSLSTLRQSVRIAKGDWLQDDAIRFAGLPPAIEQNDLIREGD